VVYIKCSYFRTADNFRNMNTERLLDHVHKRKIVHCKAFPLLFVFLLELIYFEDQKSFFSFTLLQINQVSHLFGKHILNHWSPFCI